jgi:large-conductance mechanosensitive channel
MSDMTVMTFAVAFYIGTALSQFFSAITRDLITPVIAGLLPGAEKSLDKIVINLGPVKLNVGDAIGATLNLLIAFFVVSMTLPYIKAYSPVGGRR